MREGQWPRPAVKEDNSVLPTLSSLPPSAPTVVMVSLTSVSPLLYASPNINRQMASLINTHQTSGMHQRRRHHLITATSPCDSRCLWNDRDDGNCVWDSNDAPDDDLIRRVLYNWAREEWRKSRSKSNGEEMWIRQQLSYSGKKHFSIKSAAEPWLKLKYSLLPLLDIDFFSISISPAA